MGLENLAPTRIQFTVHPVSSKSLYQLRYPGPYQNMCERSTACSPDTWTTILSFCVCVILMDWSDRLVEYNIIYRLFIMFTVSGH